MAMTGAGMRDAVFNALFASGAYGSMTEPELADVKANMLIAENARVVYIQSNAVVSTTVAASIPVSTTGTAAAQTGVTTAPGSGSGTVA